MWVAPAEHEPTAARWHLAMAMHLEDILGQLLGVARDRIEAQVIVSHRVPSNSSVGTTCCCGGSILRPTWASSICACGKAVATALPSARGFVEVGLLLRIGERVPWTGALQALLGAHEVAPADMVGDEVAQACADPGGCVAAGPVLLARRRLGHHLAQLLLHCRRHRGRGLMRG